MPKKAKVLHIISSLGMGGAERMLHKLLAGGLQSRCKNFVVSMGGEGTIGSRISALDVPVMELNIGQRRTVDFGLRRLYRVTRTFQPDIVQGWMYHGNLGANAAAVLAADNPALAWNVRHSLYDIASEKRVTRQVIRVNRFFSRRPNVILYNSDCSRKQHQAFGFKAENSETIPNGFDLERFAPSEQVSQVVRDRLGIPKNARIVGHVARYHAMKNHAGFVKAAVRVMGQLKDVHFVLSGRGVSPENDALVRLVPSEIRKNFHWLGERDDVSDLMCAMDLFCQSSSWGEGFPNVLGEAMATGLPCVATDVADSSIIVGKSGVVVPIGDTELLESGLLQILEMPDNERKALGLIARESIRERFSLKTIVHEYAAVYERLMMRSEDR